MKSAIVTLTAAGAVDATYRVDKLEPGAFTRATTYAREVSGKGVNLSAALAHARASTAAVVVLGQDDLEFAASSEHAAILRPVPVGGGTRVNTSIIDSSGQTTKVNAPTPPLSAEAWSRAVGVTLAEIDALDAAWFVLCGTIPSAPSGGAHDLIALASDVVSRGARVAVDTSGPALALLVESEAPLSLIKPNTHELAELTGAALFTVGDVVTAAETLVDHGVETVYVSMGADGALVVTADFVLHARAQPRRLVNTAGAGDASLAGFLRGRENSSIPDGEQRLAHAAATAAAWGAHAVAHASTVLPHLDHLPVSVVTIDPDRARPLTEPAPHP